MARPAGRVVLIGIPESVTAPVEFHEMRRKELALFNVRRQNHNTAAAIRLLAEGRQPFAEILTHVRPLEETGAAFRMLERYADGVGKVVITL